MLKFIPLLLLFAACRGDNHKASATPRGLVSTAELATGGDCIDPRDFGAAVDDGLPVAAKRTLCMPVEQLDINEVSKTCSGRKPGSINPGDWYMLCIFSDRTLTGNFILDGAALTDVGNNSP